MESPAPKETLELLRRLSLLQNVMVRVGIHRTASGQELGLTNQQAGVLGTIQRAPGVTVGDVSEQTFLLPPAVSRTVKALQAAGMIERRREPGDLRVVVGGPVANSLMVRPHVEGVSGVDEGR